MSSIDSAPATIPPTSEVTFNPAFAPLSVGTVRCSPARSRRPADSASASTGTGPPTDTRVGSSKRHRGPTEGVREPHLEDLLRWVVNRRKSQTPSAALHPRVSARSPDRSHRWIEVCMPRCTRACRASRNRSLNPRLRFASCAASWCSAAGFGRPVARRPLACSQAAASMCDGAFTRPGRAGSSAPRATPLTHHSVRRWTAAPQHPCDPPPGRPT
jgi:hypothetical protein